MASPVNNNNLIFSQLMEKVFRGEKATDAEKELFKKLSEERFQESKKLRALKIIKQQEMYDQLTLILTPEQLEKRKEDQILFQERMNT